LEEDLPRVIELLADLERQRKAERQEPSEPEFFLDSGLVTQMYVDSEERHRELLRILAANGGSWLFTEELAEIMKMENGSRGMAGMLGAFGRRAKHRYGGLKPWDSVWEPGREEARYSMDPEVAEWVKAAAKQAGEN
jgi:hypothetical protein